MADTPAGSSLHESRFTSQAHAVEDRLKADTVGLVHFSDFRKRRAEAFEAAQDAVGDAKASESSESNAKAAFKKRKKVLKKGGLSFGHDENEEDEGPTALNQHLAKESVAKSSGTPTTSSETPEPAQDVVLKKRAFKANASVAIQPKVMTKSALLKEAQLKDALKREYTLLQEAVKATEIVIPFVFYNGKDVPGGTCRVKKGDFIWLFLERARKVGAELVGKGDGARKDWARISVDDLMVVKNGLIIPHHYDFHYFIIDAKAGYHGPIFPYNAEPTPSTPQHLLPNSTVSAPTEQGGLMTAEQRAEQAAAAAASRLDDSELEGFHDNPSLTKVVDRRWYERNKHVFPASEWEDFDPEKDYSTAVRKDANGNAMFFSR